MQFKVPQFLEIEDKIFGPFTFRQFVYLVGGGGICFTLYKLLGLWLGAIPIIIIGGLSLALTFYRPNNKPFIEMLASGFRYAMQDKLYIWKRAKNPNITNNQNEKSLKVGNYTPANNQSYNGQRLSGSKLKDLAWSLDVLDLKK